jgi:hypothetical protein
MSYALIGMFCGYSRLEHMLPNSHVMEEDIPEMQN